MHAVAGIAFESEEKNLYCSVWSEVRCENWGNGEMNIHKYYSAGRRKPSIVSYSGKRLKNTFRRQRKKLQKKFTKQLARQNDFFLGSRMQIGTDAENLVNLAKRAPMWCFRLRR